MTRSWYISQEIVIHPKFPCFDRLPIVFFVTLSHFYGLLDVQKTKHFPTSATNVYPFFSVLTLGMKKKSNMKIATQWKMSKYELSKLSYKNPLFLTCTTTVASHWKVLHRKKRYNKQFVKYYISFFYKFFKVNKRIDKTGLVQKLALSCLCDFLCHLILNTKQTLQYWFEVLNEKEKRIKWKKGK